MKLLKILSMLVVLAILLILIHQSTSPLSSSSLSTNQEVAVEIPEIPTEAEVEIPEPSEEIPKVSYWNPQGDGPALIKISLSKQVAYFYKGEHLAGVALISSGRKGQETPVGTFKVEQKIQNHRSGNYGSFVERGTGRIVQSKVNRQKTKVPAGCYYVGSPMYYYLKFAPEIGIHSGFLPGYPDSSGCVRVTESMAKHFFENAEVGTPVIVEP